MRVGGNSRGAERAGACCTGVSLGTPPGAPGLAVGALPKKGSWGPVRAARKHETWLALRRFCAAALLCGGTTCGTGCLSCGGRIRTGDRGVGLRLLGVLFARLRVRAGSGAVVERASGRQLRLGGKGYCSVRCGARPGPCSLMACWSCSLVMPRRPVLNCPQLWIARSGFACDKRVKWNHS